MTKCKLSNLAFSFFKRNLRGCFFTARRFHSCNFLFVRKKFNKLGLGVHRIRSIMLNRTALFVDKVILLLSENSNVGYIYPAELTYFSSQLEVNRVNNFELFRVPIIL